MPGAVPPGMEHAIILEGDDGEGAHVTTIASLVTRPYGPRVDPILTSDVPAIIRATQDDIARAAQYELNIRHLIEFGLGGEA